MIFRFMMFSEHLEHGKCDFQHLESALQTQKPDFRWFSSKARRLGLFVSKYSIFLMFAFVEHFLGVGNHICRAPNALKTSEIERLQFFTSKLYPKKFINSRKICIFEITFLKKYFLKKCHKNPKIFQNQISKIAIFRFQKWSFSILKIFQIVFKKFPKIFFGKIFWTRKNIFCRSWEKNWI